MKKTCAALVAGMLAFGAALGAAHAQAWLADRALTEGRGIRVGNFELHPGIGAEFGYDSNVNGSSTAPVGALRIRATPSFSISTIGQQRLQGAQPTTDFRAYVNGSYHEFISLDPAVLDGGRLRNVGVAAGVRVALFPHRNWTFTFFDDFRRVVQGVGDAGFALNQFNRIVNDGGIQVGWNPSSGIVGLQLGYRNHLEIFENPDFNFYNLMVNEISVANRWRFFPQTAFMFEAAVIPTLFFNPAGSGGTSPGYLLASSHPIRARFGLNGLFSERFGILAMVGYQGTFFDGGDNADAFIAQLELRYIIDQRSQFLGGVMRDVQPAYIGSFNVRNRLYLDYTHIFGGRFLLSARASGGIMEYGCFADRTSGACAPGRVTGTGVDMMTGRFTTYRVDGTLFGEYRFTEYFGLNATLSLSANLGDVQVQSGTTSLPVTWLKAEAYIGLRLSI